MRLARFARLGLLTVLVGGQVVAQTVPPEFVPLARGAAYQLGRLSALYAHCGSAKDFRALGGNSIGSLAEARAEMEKSLQGDANGPQILQEFDRGAGSAFNGGGTDICANAQGQTNAIMQTLQGMAAPYMPQK